MSTVGTPKITRADPARLGHQPPVEGHRAHLHPGRRGRAAGLASSRRPRWPAAAPRCCGPAARPGVRQRARRADRQHGRPAGARRPEGHLPVRLAGRRRREPLRPHLPRPEPVPGQLGAAGGSSHQQRAAARRRDRQGRGRHLRRELAGADRRRRRGRLRWRAERLRAAEGDDRRRRRRFALGGPAGFGEEVRPPRRQGADPDPAAHPHADLGSPGGRRRRRADGRHRPHRRRGGHADHLRRRRARPAVHHRRADQGRLLPGQERPRAVHRPRQGLRAVLRSDLDGDRHPGPGAGQASSPRASRASSPTRCWPTTARRRSTGASTSTTRPSRSSRRSSARWASSSSSSRWPASTP